MKVLEDRVKKLEEQLCCLVKKVSNGFIRPNGEDFNLLRQKNVVAPADYVTEPHLTGEYFELEPGVMRPVYRKLVRFTDIVDSGNLAEAGSDIEAILHIGGWFVATGDTSPHLHFSCYPESAIILDTTSNSIDQIIFDGSSSNSFDGLLILEYIKVNR